MFCCAVLYVHCSFAIVLMGCFDWFVLLLSSDCFVALLRGAMGSSVVCDCGIFQSYPLTILLTEINAI